MVLGLRKSFLLISNIAHFFLGGVLHGSDDDVEAPTNGSAGADAERAPSSDVHIDSLSLASADQKATEAHL